MYLYYLVDFASSQMISWHTFKTIFKPITSERHIVKEGVYGFDSQLWWTQCRDSVSHWHAHRHPGCNHYTDKNLALKVISRLVWYAKMPPQTTGLPLLEISWKSLPCVGDAKMTWKRLCVHGLATGYICPKNAFSSPLLHRDLRFTTAWDHAVSLCFCHDHNVKKM